MISKPQKLIYILDRLETLRFESRVLDVIFSWNETGSDSKDKELICGLNEDLNGHAVEPRKNQSFNGICQSLKHKILLWR